MTLAEVRTKVAEVNGFLAGCSWMDFEVLRYESGTLVVMGSLDISDPHDIEVHFHEVAFVSLPIEWKTDTTKPVLSVFEGDKAVTVNLTFQVEQGHHLFRFAPEDYPDQFGCLVGAKGISWVAVRPRK